MMMKWSEGKHANNFDDLLGKTSNIICHWHREDSFSMTWRIICWCFEDPTFVNDFEVPYIFAFYCSSMTPISYHPAPEIIPFDY
jgi:hypothetical protein